MACVCLKSPPVKAGIMTLGSVATSGLLVGGMALGLHFTGPTDPNYMTVPQVAVIGVTILLGCILPIWVPEAIQDYIEDL